MTVDLQFDNKMVFLLWEEAKHHFNDGKIVSEIQKFREANLLELDNIKKELQQLNILS